MNTNTNHHWLATAKTMAKKAVNSVHVENGKVNVTVYDFNKGKTPTNVAVTNTIVQPVVIPQKTDWVAITGLTLSFVMCALAVISFVRRRRRNKS